MLDFTKGRKAEPPARMLAQTKAIMKARKLPSQFAEVLAARMESAAEIEALIPALESLRDLIEMASGSLDDAGTLLEAALVDLSANSQQDDTDEDAPAEKKLMAAVVKQIAMKKRAENPLTDRMRPGNDWNSPGAQRAKMVDALTARIDRGHVPTIGREFAAMTLSDLAIARAHVGRKAAECSRCRADGGPFHQRFSVDP